jgi:hypothetical protein
MIGRAFPDGRSDRVSPDDRDRAVSITVNYVIALSITAVLISGLLVGASGYVENQRDRVVREELEVVGEQLAAGIDDADRLARAASDPGTVRVGVDLPRRVAGETYRIEIVEIDDPPDQPARSDLRLRSAGSDVSVTLTLSTLVPLQNGSTSGGWTVVRLDSDAAGDDVLVVDEGGQSRSLSLARPEGGIPG